MSQLHFQLATITLSLYSQASESEKVGVRACCTWMTFSLLPHKHVLNRGHMGWLQISKESFQPSSFKDNIFLCYWWKAYNHTLQEHSWFNPQCSFLFGCLHPQNAHRRTVARRFWVHFQLWAFLQPSFLPQPNDLPPGENDGLVAYPGWVTASTGKGSRFDNWKKMDGCSIFFHFLSGSGSRQLVGWEHS